MIKRLLLAALLLLASTPVQAQAVFNGDQLVRGISFRDLFATPPSLMSIESTADWSVPNAVRSYFADLPIIKHSINFRYPHDTDQIRARTQAKGCRGKTVTVETAAYVKSREHGSHRLTREFYQRHDNCVAVGPILYVSYGHDYSDGTVWSYDGKIRASLGCPTGPYAGCGFPSGVTRFEIGYVRDKLDAVVWESTSTIGTYAGVDGYLFLHPPAGSASRSFRMIGGGGGAATISGAKQEGDLIMYLRRRFSATAMLTRPAARYSGPVYCSPKCVWTPLELVTQYPASETAALPTAFGLSTSALPFGGISNRGLWLATGVGSLTCAWATAPSGWIVDYCEDASNYGFAFGQTVGATPDRAMLNRRARVIAGKLVVETVVRSGDGYRFSTISGDGRVSPGGLAFAATANVSWITYQRSGGQGSKIIARSYYRGPLSKFEPHGVGECSPDDRSWSPCEFETGELVTTAS